MYWLARHLASHGFVVLVYTPTNIFGPQKVWKIGHETAFEQLKNLNDDEDSPIYGIVDTSKIGVIGYSMGGGGAAMMVSQRKDVSALVMLAPWLDFKLDSRSNAPSLVITGSKDTVASGFSHGYKIFNSIPRSTDKVYLRFKDLDHSGFAHEGGFSEHYRLGTFVTSFLLHYLAKESGWAKYSHWPLLTKPSWFDVAIYDPGK